MANLNPVEVPEKDAPLRDDIRLLGRILGDTVREQQGEAVFGVVERIRQTSIRFHRSEDNTARRELEATLNSLSRGHAIQVIRAYSFFSHLANIAEDQHHIRRTRAHAFTPSAPREGTMAHALARAKQVGVTRRQLEDFFATGLVGPVLTAHPTEVRRKSTIDREMEVAELLAERDRVALTPEEVALGEEALRRAVLTLWQTNLLRGTRLTVLDEVANGHLLLRLHLPARAAALLRRARRPAGLVRPGLGRCRAAHRSCAWAAGSAAIATAIPLSRRRCCARHCGCRATGRCGSISTSCICWGPSCLWTDGWSASPTS